jgi:signal transduction histidine kinase
VLDLRAAPLEGRGLSAALRTLADELTAHAGLAVEVELVGDDERLAPRITIGLYRIAQEALANVVRHAAATQVELRLEISGGRTKLSVVDNGVGFDPARTVQNRFGLIGIGERAHLLGGALHIESAPGRGVRLLVELPA